jgi:hypothetical protein
MFKLVTALFGCILFIFSGQMGWSQTAPEGKFLTFNGIDQHLSIPNHSDFNIAAGESYTICFRIRTSNFDASYSILNKGDLLATGGRYGFSTIKSTSVPNFNHSLINSGSTNLSSPNLALLSAGNWVHVAWVYNAGDKSSRIYLNGVLQKSVLHGSIGKVTVSNTHDIKVGCSMSDADETEYYEHWPGGIDELRVWKRSLAADEVLADRTAVKASGSGLVAAYDFENLSGNTAPDVSGRGHNGHLYGFGTRVVKTLLPVGAGEKNERLTAFRVVGESSRETLKNVTIHLAGTTSLSDLSAVSVYYNGSKERYNTLSAKLFGTSAIIASKLVISGDLPLAPGDNYFWVTADMHPQAREGNKVNATLLSYTASERGLIMAPAVEGSRTILLGSKLLFSGGDEGSKYYRIPAIVTARDGSLVTATDKRWNSALDLPSHIDVVIRRSTDQGRTWSKAVTIAGDGINTGYGDPALVVNRKNGEIICLFASDKGFFNSTATSPIRIYQSKSADNGITWSVPRDITPQIYGAECANPLTQGWQGAFISSGSALQLRGGRIMAVLPVRENSTRAISNFVIYSDDDAKTWKVSSGRASTNGNEAKMAELDNGKLLMSIRNSGTRMFNQSKDFGRSWGIPYAQTSILDPNCNGDLIRYTSVTEGYKKNRLLHSIPYAGSRKNVSVLMSYDEGVTWPVRKTIYSGASAYSALTILSDGTIGMYYEVGEYETYQMYFARFSLSWLTDGADIWTGKLPSLANSTNDNGELESGYTVYPNPAKGLINLSGTFDTERPIEIYNSLGILVDSRRVEPTSTLLQLSVYGYPAGVYFVKNGGVTRQFLVVE